MTQPVHAVLTMVVCICSCCHANVSAQAEGGSAPQSVTTFVDYEAPPPTLAGLWASAAVVVRGRVVGSSQRRHDSTARLSIPLIAYDFQVGDVLKSDAASLGTMTQITVLEHGGTITDQQGRTVTASPSAPKPYEPGQELILFLNPSPLAGGFSVAYGAAGSFPIDKDEVRLPRAARSYNEFQGHETVPTASFLAALRTLAKR